LKSIHELPSLDGYVEGEMARRNIPGISVGIACGTREVTARYYGCSNVEHDCRTKAETVYKIGSISKQFVATGVLVLVQNGLVHLDDPISCYLLGIPSAWSGITVRHLLSHTSGLQRESPGFDPYVPRPNHEIVAAAYPLRLLFRPGDNWRYSNLGYSVLAELIEKMSGIAFDKFIRQSVFTPAGLSATRTCSIADIVRGRSASYLDQSGRLTNAGDFLSVRASGAFTSNINDLLRWDTVLRANTVLSAESRAAMESPAALNDGTLVPYGLGWELASINGRRLVHHGGTLWCFRAEFARYVDDELAVVVLANHMNANAREMALTIAGFVKRELVAPPDVLVGLIERGRSNLDETAGRT